MVSDVLKPPTYAYGAYGSWTAPPPPAAVAARGRRAAGRVRGDHAQWLTRPPTFVIVGSGVIGSLAARRLAEAGRVGAHPRSGSTRHAR